MQMIPNVNTHTVYHICTITYYALGFTLLSSYTQLTINILPINYGSWVGSH